MKIAQVPYPKQPWSAVLDDVSTLGTALQVIQVNAGATTVEYVSSTGTGSVVRADSPTFTTQTTSPKQKFSASTLRPYLDAPAAAVRVRNGTDTSYSGFEARIIDANDDTRVRVRTAASSGSTFYYDASGNNTVSIESPTGLITATAFKLLTGTNNYVMTSDASGNLTLQAPAGGTPTAITVANESIDTTCFVGFFTGATGDLGPKTNAALTFNSSTGALGAGAITASGNVQINSTSGIPLDVKIAGTSNLAVDATSGWLKLRDNYYALAVIANSAGSPVLVASSSQLYLNSSISLSNNSPAVAPDTYWTRAAANSSKFVGSDGTTLGAIQAGTVTAAAFNGPLGTVTPASVAGTTGTFSGLLSGKNIFLETATGPSDPTTITMNSWGSNGSWRFESNYNSGSPSWQVTSNNSSVSPIKCYSSGLIEFSGATASIGASGSLKLGIKTIATLPSAASSTNERYIVSDSAVTGGRTAYSNGSAWYYDSGVAV